MIEKTNSVTTFRPTISWGAIFGGWIFAYAFAMLLYLLGAAVGVTTLSAMNRIEGEVTIGTGVWMVAAWIIATFTGSVITGRLAGFERRSSGAFHGLIVWALSGIMTLFLGTVQAGMVAAAGAGATHGIVQTAQGQNLGGLGDAAKAATARAVSGVTGGQVSSDNINRAMNDLQPQVAQQVAAAIAKGDTESAKRMLADNTSLSEQDINQIVGGVQGKTEQAKDNAGRAAEKGGDVASAGLWAFLIASLLGMGAGAWGGAVGATMAVRAYVREGQEVEIYSHTNYQEPEERKAV
ncbi:MAG TPA: hypothetical protein VL688_00130 [Verrucomicrobiae bacterium]|nr:hypothetical protein [Verrucomicrobiae bacterium]